MNLSTTYMGFELPHPLVPGPRRWWTTWTPCAAWRTPGAAMIVMHSLFEEQIAPRRNCRPRLDRDTPRSRYAEALSYFPEPDEFNLGRTSTWSRFAGSRRRVGAGDRLAQRHHRGRLAALRPADRAGRGRRPGAEPVRAGHRPRGDRRRRWRRAACRWSRPSSESVTIPLAVKLSPFYSSIANFARRSTSSASTPWSCSTASTSPTSTSSSWKLLRVNLSSPAELLLRLRWLAILSGRIKRVAGGHRRRPHRHRRGQGGDGRRHAVQMVSALLQRGPAYLQEVRDDWPVAGGARVRVAAADAGQHEPVALRRSRAYSGPTTSGSCRAGTPAEPCRAHASREASVPCGQPRRRAASLIAFPSSSHRIMSTRYRSGCRLSSSSSSACSTCRFSAVASGCGTALSLSRRFRLMARVFRATLRATPYSRSPLSPRADGGGLVDQQQEGRLKHVIGVGRVAKDTAAHAEHHRAVPPHRAANVASSRRPASRSSNSPSVRPPPSCGSASRRHLRGTRQCPGRHCIHVPGRCSTHFVPRAPPV